MFDEYIIGCSATWQESVCCEPIISVVAEIMKADLFYSSVLWDISYHLSNCVVYQKQKIYVRSYLCKDTVNPFSSSVLWGITYHFCICVVYQKQKISVRSYLYKDANQSFLF
jgi:hypothetical protein